MLEFRHVIDPLVNPTAHRGEATDAFYPVIPSMPGFGCSGQPTEPGWHIGRIVMAWITLTDRLGYGRRDVQGGDWGAMPPPTLGHMAPRALAGLNLNFVPFQRTPDERRMLEDAARYKRGYLA